MLEALLRWRRALECLIRWPLGGGQGRLPARVPGEAAGKASQTGRGVVSISPPPLLALAAHGAPALPVSSVGQIRGSLSSPNTQIWLPVGLYFNPLCYLNRGDG